jgi:drug/metabolite transporter (DMT)-like permease
LQAENRTRGIVWMMATMACFVALDAMMKLGLEHYSVAEVAWGRFFFATIFAVLWCGRDLPQLSQSKAPAQQSVRSILLMVTTVLFSVGLLFLPLPTASTIMFMSPIFTTMLSVLLLGEHVGPRRWAGVALGFVGAIIVVQPWQAGTDTFNIGTLFMLAAALTNSGYQIATRKVRGDDARTSLLFTAAFGAVITSAVVPFYWTSPDIKGWAMLAGSGLAGTRAFLHYRSLPQCTCIGGGALLLYITHLGHSAGLSDLVRFSRPQRLGGGSTHYQFRSLHLLARTPAQHRTRKSGLGSRDLPNMRTKLVQMLFFSSRHRHLVCHAVGFIIGDLQKALQRCHFRTFGQIAKFQHHIGDISRQFPFL